ncbi:hypothetical protein BT93_L5846 [Corymbia citriodora subsp. variegata]|uniref:Uncharacterized protein n=1 Tax=Corymbia citriodora subsp. variegata TaxID=360336 RepID=A0A8T0CR39_CORYI|nr:hypothetical protein BT93_L5846 [Corymbia citriodora subsp. variegata]
MAPLDRNGTDWAVFINEKLKCMPPDDEQIWRKRCVYKVPTCVTDHNSKAYHPQAVSFGPYHHGELHLLPMEEHKERALLHFLKRSKKPIEPFLESLREVLQDLEDSYEGLDPKWKGGGCECTASPFLMLMITDGCFMLEILRTASQKVEDYASNDPIFGNHGKHYIMPYIRRDMLMLENQLPMKVLDQLVTVENNGKKDNEFINKLILKFHSPGTRITTMGKCLHVLDVFRKSMLMEFKNNQSEEDKMGHDGSEEIIWSATELNEAGIWFKKSMTDSIRDISYSWGVLRLPKIVVDDTTESTFLNLIAFERFHVGAGNEVTSYVYFMNNIIDNERDVALLHAQGIIQNAIGSNKAVAKLFNSMSKDVALDCDSRLDAVHRKVSSHCKQCLNRWRAHLNRNYFRNPWARLSLIAVIVLLTLTIIQTVYIAKG